VLILVISKENKMKKIILYTLLLIIVSCNKIDKDKKVDKNKLLGADYRLFQDTPVWNLAKAVWDDDVDKIDKEVKNNPKVINYQESKYGKTLLHLSIYNDNYKAFKELLKLGANPNISDSSHCTSPLIEASESFDNKFKYAEELVKYKADVNYVECNDGKEAQKMNRTPLITASSHGHLEIVKILIKNGANINYDKSSALSSAVLGDHYDVILYLLQQGADCSKLLYKKGGGDNLTDIYMKNWIEDEADHSAKEYSEIKELLKKKGCL
jgi:ankyrin repeat protein